MKRNGNINVNKIYNPRNKRPDMPLDADEVDSAMERFIRKKYQEKSLVDGKPEPPVRNAYSPVVPSKSPEGSPPPPVPSKKHRFFGFGLRASSFAYPLSKHDKKKLPPEPRVDEAFAFSSDDYGQVSRAPEPRAPLSSEELETKLLQLRDMGFEDVQRNASVLRRLNGDIERTVNALVQLGPSSGQRSTSAKAKPQPTSSSRTNATAPTNDTANPAMQSSTTSNDPFSQLDDNQGFGLSVAQAQKPQPTGASYGSNNPFDQQARSQTDGGLVDAFQGMQVSQPPQLLFPHSTGGYPSQQAQMPNARLQTMTPPVPNISQQYGYTASPSSLGGNTNPFFQQVQPQATGNNPFFGQPQQQQQQQQQYQQSFQPQQLPAGQNYNPFMTTSPPSQAQQPISSANPFGIPPQQSPPPLQTQLPRPPNTQNVFDYNQPQSSMGGTNPWQQQTNQAPMSAPPQMPNIEYSQQQVQWQQTQQQSAPFQQSNPYASMPQGQPQVFQQQAYQPQASLVPQQTGRYDKSSILALYNHPQLAPAKPQQLSSIPEPGHEVAQNTMPDAGMAAKRSATMPIAMSHMHSAGGAGNVGAVNRNPFTQNSQPQQSGRHVSQESVNMTNFDSGRHSPDAFANLSARYVG